MFDNAVGNIGWQINSREILKQIDTANHRIVDICFISDRTNNITWPNLVRPSDFDTVSLHAAPSAIVLRISLLLPFRVAWKIFKQQRIITSSHNSQASRDQLGSHLRIVLQLRQQVREETNLLVGTGFDNRLLELLDPQIIDFFDRLLLE